MQTIFRLSRVCLCLVVLLFVTACNDDPQAKAKPKHIGWKEAAQKMSELERVKKQTFEALKAKSQARKDAQSTKHKNQF